MKTAETRTVKTSYEHKTTKSKSRYLDLSIVPPHLASVLLLLGVLELCQEVAANLHQRLEGSRRLLMLQRHVDFCRFQNFQLSTNG